MIKCSQCGQEIQKPVASISGSVMGDEDIDTYYFCDTCQVYTVEAYHDRFSGEESTNMRGPVSKQEGDEAIATIKKCSDPMEKKCRCAAHRDYFGSSLD